MLSEQQDPPPNAFSLCTVENCIPCRVPMLKCSNIVRWASGFSKTRQPPDGCECKEVSLAECTTLLSQTALKLHRLQIQIQL